MGGSFFAQHGPHRQTTPPSHAATGFARVHALCFRVRGSPELCIIESVAHPDNERKARSYSRSRARLTRTSRGKGGGRPTPSTPPGYGPV